MTEISKGRQEAEADQHFAYFGGKRLRTWSTREEMDKRNAQRGRAPLSDELWISMQQHAREQDAITTAKFRERDEARAKAGFTPRPDSWWEKFEKAWANDFPPEEMEKLTQEFRREGRERQGQPQERKRSPLSETPEEEKRSIEKARAQIAAMTPQEREASNKRMEELQKKWDYGTTPEGKREFAAFFVNSLKKQGRIPPDIDHLWLNLPSGWAEYRELPAKEADKAASYTVTLDKTPTQAQWDEYYPDLQAKMKAWKVEKARREAVELHAGDPRYDPMTGDLLKPDELPLDAAAEYLLTGKTRPRRFIPPGSPYLNNGYKPVRPYVGEQPESEGTQRHIQRLLKAGFVEVEPVGSDWQFFTFRERLRNMSPYEIAKEWQEIQRESRERLGISEKSFGEILGELAFDVFDMMMRLLLGLPTKEEEEEKEKAKIASN
jgi:hypothetical protein